MRCDEVQELLGQLIDEELDDDNRRDVESHIEDCAACRGEHVVLQSLTVDLAQPPDAPVPPGLWAAIEERLDREPLPLSSPDEPTAPGVAIQHRQRWRPLAAAAIIVLAVGLSWGLFNLPGTSTALAHTIDFGPLLNQVGDDLERGLAVWLEAYGGRPTTLEEASETMKVRVHPPESLPGDMELKSTHMLKMGDHPSLTLHFSGPGGQMLVMQCAPGMRKDYGGRDCLPCQVGSRPGQIVREGPWRLVHVESDNVCICVVSTLDEHEELPAVLEALKIDY